jgi:predicted DCC family thiol-disulfide oxidoreductase YuxK
MTPEATPALGRPVLVFDGDCGFCTTWARRWQRWSGLDRVEPWQFLDLESLGLTEDQCSTAVQWVAEDGTVAGAEDAVIAALRHGGNAWAVLGRMLALPGVHALAGAVYRLVAKYRYRLPGSTPACRLPRA